MVMINQSSLLCSLSPPFSIMTSLLAFFWRAVYTYDKYALHHFCVAPSKPRFLTVTTTFTQGLQLNWIPPKQPNGPILYQLNYGTNTTQFTTVHTAGDDTYHNLTGLQQNTAYYIRVVAVSYMTLNGVARTEGEWIAATTESEGLNSTL